jgi:DNA-binding NarL/FixJ family response regulator
MLKSSLPIRIILADDHEIFRDGFKVMLRKQPEFSLVGEAANGKELIEQTHSLQPDVIITDIKMPGIDGIEATRRISAEFPGLGIIALSMFDEENLIVDMLEAGAKGYLLKNASKEEIREAIHAVYAEQTYYCSNTSLKLTQLIAKSSFNPHRRSSRPELNPKEIEVIRLICQQMSNKEIASQLNLSVRTIEGYRDKIQDKLKVKNMAGIVVYAIKNNIYKPD